MGMKQCQCCGGKTKSTKGLCRWCQKEWILGEHQDKYSYCKYFLENKKTGNRYAVYVSNEVVIRKPHIQPKIERMEYWDGRGWGEALWRTRMGLVGCK